MIVFFSCDDIFEKDISDVTIGVYHPGDTMITSNSSVLFFWEDKPSIDSTVIRVVPISMQASPTIIDTFVLANNQISLYILPGKYNWELQGFNSAYSTNLTKGYLEVDSSLDISDIELKLFNPSKNLLTNTNIIKFNWQNLYNADVYRYTLKDTLGFSYLDTLTVTNELILDLSDDHYRWSVRGYNNTSGTKTMVATRLLAVDTKSPAVSDVLIPQDGEVINTQQVSFSWLRHADSGSQVYDSLIVIDSKARIVLSEKIETTYYTDSLSQGDYYWYLKTYDIAGNYGGYTQPSLFTIK